ncbi:tryptophan synthase subunit alpha [Alicyclobacillus acidiphilus]|uniref:tryptophan synthase subunit alpha n=1 Tax=Alicyclobacillus acidiphilus TaxID=182455 RepID=UPI00082BABD8|nr:tryptophan synthase subunit alpha [Alicyclobacillus acidiphilus]
MNRIDQTFAGLNGEAALIPFVVAGDPDYGRSLDAIVAILEAGADMVEIGFPYSDPLADGPVIQAAALRSLQQGHQLPDCFRLIRDVRSKTEKPLIAFTYVNPVMQYGTERFFRDLAASGGDGVIIPDVPIEEAPELAQMASQYDISFIPLVAPTSGEERVRAISAQAHGFVYCVSSLGVTGERSSVASGVKSLVETVKRYTDLPACVGFGVSTPEHAAEIAAFADGVIVGSAYVRRIEQAQSEGDGSVAESVAEFTRQLKNACQRIRL